MTKLRVHRHRRHDGRFTKQVDIYLHDRKSPRGILYAPCASMDEARRVIGREVAAFRAAGQPLRVIGM